MREQDAVDLAGWLMQAMVDHVETCLACRFNFGSGKCAGCGARYSGAATAVTLSDGTTVPYVVHWCEACLEAERARTGYERIRLDTDA